MVRPIATLASFYEHLFSINAGSEDWSRTFFGDVREFTLRSSFSVSAVGNGVVIDPDESAQRNSRARGTPCLLNERENSYRNDYGGEKSNCKKMGSSER